MAWGAIVGGVLSGSKQGGGGSGILGGGMSGAVSPISDMSNRSPIHIAPVGVNLGAILAPFQEGSPENGGFGLDLMSRYAADMGAPRATSLTTPIVHNDSQGMLIAAAGGLLLLLIMLRTKKKRR